MIVPHDKNRPHRRAVLTPQRLRARNVRGGRTLEPVRDLKGNGVADLQFGVGHTLEFLGVEKQVLGLAFARNEPKAFFRQRLDSTSHAIMSTLT